MFATFSNNHNNNKQLVREANDLTENGEKVHVHLGEMESLLGVEFWFLCCCCFYSPSHILCLLSVENDLIEMEKRVRKSAQAFNSDIILIIISIIV